MNNLRVKLLTVLIILPTLAFASGDRVLLTFEELIVEIIILLVIVIILKLNIWRKVFLILVYFITDSLIMLVNANKPYFANATKIDLDLCLIPALTVILSYLLIKAFLPQK